MGDYRDLSTGPTGTSGPPAHARSPDYAVARFLGTPSSSARSCVSTFPCSVKSWDSVACTSSATSGPIRSITRDVDDKIAARCALHNPPQLAGLGNRPA